MENKMDSTVVVADAQVESGIGNFFSRYSWTINPFLTLRELLDRMSSEVDYYEDLSVPWQREGSLTNLYVFASAISCAVDEFIFRRRWYIQPLGRRFPTRAGTIEAAERVLNFPHDVLTSIRFRKVWKWKTMWDRVLEEICGVMADSKEINATQAEVIRILLDRIKHIKAPASLFEERTKINEGYRCQDLTYQDVFSLGRKFLEASPEKDARLVIVGSRTAGNYLCPMLKVYLKQSGFNDVSWIALRPRFGLHERERWWLRRRLNGDVNVILLDDFSNTGNTFRMLEKVVVSFGVPAAKITILAPIHPHMPGDLAPSDNAVRVLKLHYDELYTREMLKPERAEQLVKELLAADDIGASFLDETQEVLEINRELWSHYSESYQVHLKRVFDVSIRNNDGSTEVRRVIGKFAGVGWFGYHAYFAGAALQEFVPKVYGLRRGIVFMEWVVGASLNGRTLSESSIKQMSSYIAARTNRLRLSEDPRSQPPYLGWGWLHILGVLRLVYGNVFGYPKNRAILDRLKKSLVYPPTLVDARMRPSEWLSRGETIVKVDFEQHAFGPPELDVVDPAYDIAVTSFEFELDPEQENIFIFNYCQESGDQETLKERVVLYKLLYGTAESGRMHHRITLRNKGDDAASLNARLQHGWNFRVYAMNQLWADRLEFNSAGAPTSSSPIFFMDLDGVFDSEVLGFPHTTPSGLKAIDLFRRKGYSIVPNTGRSAEHIKNYCRSFGFEAALGEYGSILYDNHKGLEIPLVDKKTLEQLDVCRTALGKIEGVFLDPDYRCAIRAYRYTSQGISGMDPVEAEGLIREAGLNRLKVIAKKSDTYFVGIDIDKGSAVKFYLNYSQRTSNVTFAMGDSVEDIPMLDSVTHAYAPANCSREIVNIARQRGYEIVSQIRQRGLLHVAEMVTGLDSRIGDEKNPLPLRLDPFTELMVKLLDISESTRNHRLLLLLDRKGLGFGYNRD